MRVGSKWKIFLTCVVLGITYGTENASGQHQRPGRKYRVPGGYEVQFGTWPLMQVTKLHNTKRPIKFGSLGGFMQNAIHSNFNKPQHGLKFQQHPYNQNGPNKFRRPPPPPRPIAVTKPVFFADIKAPMPPQTPLQFPVQPTSMVGFPFPVGNNHHNPMLFNNGPLPVKVVQIFAPPPTTTTEAPPPLPPPVTSVMGKAAYSGFFGNNDNSGLRAYSHPVSSFQPGHPPHSFSAPRPYYHQGPPTRPFYPQQPQAQQSSFVPQYRLSPIFFKQPPQVVMSDPVPVAPERYQMNSVPVVPPVIKIGSHPPLGYSMTHGEQQLITLKLPDVKMGKKMDTAVLLRGAEIKHGPGLSPYRRQDFFKPGPPSGASTTQSEDKKLPDVGAIYTVNMVLQTPNISAPMNGSDSPYFQQGMEEMGRIYGSTIAKQSSPLDGQVKLLGKLFTELQRLKPGKSSRVDEPQQQPSYTTTTTNGGDPFGGEQTQKNYYTPKVDAPLLAVHIQSYSVPEPGSGDPDVLDSARMFGLQGHKIEFGSTNEIINLMDTAQKSVASRVPIEELGYTRGEINHNLQEWIRSYVTLTRKMKDEAHIKGEGIASNSFKQHQVKVRMPDNSMQPMDPKMFSQGASITNAGAVATYQG